MRKCALTAMFAALLLTLCACSYEETAACYDCRKETPISKLLFVEGIDEYVCPECFSASCGDEYFVCIECGSVFRDYEESVRGYCYECSNELFTVCCICDGFPLRKSMAYEHAGVYTCANCIVRFFESHEAIDECIEIGSMYLTYPEG